MAAALGSLPTRQKSYTSGGFSHHDRHYQSTPIQNLFPWRLVPQREAVNALGFDGDAKRDLVACLTGCPASSDGSSGLMTYGLLDASCQDARVCGLHISRQRPGRVPLVAAGRRSTPASRWRCSLFAQASMDRTVLPVLQMIVSALSQSAWRSGLPDACPVHGRRAGRG